jgi:hypothetical protein
MKKISLKVLTLLAVLTTSGLVVAETGDAEGTLNQIAGYRQWTRVNRKPVQVDASPVAVASATGLV